MTEKPYVTHAERARKSRAKDRITAIEKIARGKKPHCAICGCPHAEILQIGHPKHREGRFHRRKIANGNKYGSRMTIAWILKTSIEEVLEYVQLECPYCNAWHNRFKEYPQPEKQPVWLPKMFSKPEWMA